MALERNVLLLGLTYFIGTFLLNSWGFFLPLYIEELGADVVQVGLVFTISFLAFSLMHVPAGYLADKYGRRKIIGMGTFFSGFCWLAVSMANTWLIAIPLLTLAFMLNAIYQPATYSMISESVPKTQRGTAFGSFWFFNGIALILAPLIGGFMTAIYGFRTLMILTAVWVIISGLLRLTFLHETLNGKKLVIKRAPLSLTFAKPLLVFLIASSISSLGTGLSSRYFPIYAEDFLHLTRTEVGFMFSAFNFAGFLMSIPVGKLSDKISKKLCISIGWTTSSLMIVLWVYSPNPVFAIIAYGISGGFSSCHIVPFNALIADLCPKERRALIMGSFVAFTGVISSLAISIGGVLWVVYSPIIPFLAGLVNLPAAVILLAFVREERGSAA